MKVFQKHKKCKALNAHTPNLNSEITHFIKGILIDDIIYHKFYEMQASQIQSNTYLQ